MNEAVKISVIIPVYNTSAYLSRCLDSVLNSTYQNLEVLCINDGSTDDSEAILEQYALKDRRIIVVNKVNEGVSIARNTGLEMATGDFVAFIDSDDWIHPQYFEILSNCAINTNADIVACTYDSTNSIQSTSMIDITSVQSVSMSLQMILHHSTIKRLVWGRIYSIDLLKKIRFDSSLTWGEDIVFNFMVLVNYKNLNFQYIDLPLYFYFLRHTSITYTISYIQRIALSKWYIENFSIGKTANMQQLLLRQGCNAILAFRYAEMFSEDRHAINTACDEIISKAWYVMRSSGLFSLSKLIQYRILFSFPLIYRIFRIINDKTLLIWEREQKHHIKKS